MFLLYCVLRVLFLKFYFIMKKFRGPNFSTAEIMHLLKLVEKYPIIENKRTDGATAKDKQMAWQSLTAEYNSQTNFSPRTADKLLSCYKNQKVKVKKMHSSEKMAIRGKIFSCINSSWYIIIPCNSLVHL